MIWQAIVDGFLSGAIVALGAIGVTFSLAILRFANFSHGDLLAVGAYSALFLLAIMIGEGGGGPIDSPWPWLVQPVGPFWNAEPEHQDYLQRIPNGYTCHWVRPNWKLPKRQAA